MMFRWRFFLVSLLYTSAGVLGHANCSTAAVATATGRDNCTYPSLINATSDELQQGLKKGCFTSANLVEVCISCPFQLEQNKANAVLGICATNP